MTDAECKAIEQESVEKVRKALKTLTSGEIYDGKMSKFLNQAGYDALEEIEGLDLFWICDPLITLAKDRPQCELRNVVHGLLAYKACNKCNAEYPFDLTEDWKLCPRCGAEIRKGGTE